MPTNRVAITINVSGMTRTGFQNLARDRGLTVTALVEHLAAGRLAVIPPDTLELYQRLAMRDTGAEELLQISRTLEQIASAYLADLSRKRVADDGPGSSEGN